jgi:hypothetical protein
MVMLRDISFLYYKSSKQTVSIDPSVVRDVKSLLCGIIVFDRNISNFFL